MRSERSPWRTGGRWPRHPKSLQRNVGFAILDGVLEESSGRPFADVLQSSVLTPVGMNHTYPDMATACPNGLIEGRTTVMGFPIDRPENGVEAVLADGYGMPTARDLAAYAIFQMERRATGAH
ncbi:MAG: serine hydrolase [Microbacteriaceae bacterium]